MTDQALARIASELDALFGQAPDAGYRAPRAPEIPLLAARYADIAWAMASGMPAPPAMDRLPDAATRPVFIAGVPRSGTSLLLNLLDGHPSLSVLPGEGDLLTRFAPHLRHLGLHGQLALLGKTWIARMIHGVNLPPYWLLGAPDETPNPYIGFARRVRGIGASPALGGIPTAYRAFVAIILAWSATGAGEWQRWVEKTPCHEFRVRRSLRLFPEGRCLHVVRDPRAVLHSRMTVESRTGLGASNVDRLAREIGRSMRLAHRYAARYGADRYRVVRFEELCDDTGATMRSVADFVGISFDAALLQPTIAGRPTSSNSSHSADASAGIVTPARAAPDLDAATRAVLARHAGRAAARFGY